MMYRQLYLFAYDISNRKQQARARRLLQGYAIGAQQSLFGCWLTESELAYLTAKLPDFLDDGDKLHWLNLGKHESVWLFGVAKPLCYEVFLVV